MDRHSSVWEASPRRRAVAYRTPSPTATPIAQVDAVYRTTSCATGLHTTRIARASGAMPISRVPTCRPMLASGDRSSPKVVCQSALSKIEHRDTRAGVGAVVAVSGAAIHCDRPSCRGGRSRTPGTSSLRTGAWNEPLPSLGLALNVACGCTLRTSFAALVRRTSTTQRSPQAASVARKPRVVSRPRQNVRPGVVVPDCAGIRTTWAPIAKPGRRQRQHRVMVSGSGI